MRGINSQVWVEHFEESKGSLQRIIGIARELLTNIGTTASNCENEIQCLDKQIETALADGGEDAKLFRRFGVIRAHALFRQQIDALSATPEVLAFTKTGQHGDEPSIIQFMFYNVKLENLCELAPEIVSEAEKDYLRLAKEGKVGTMIDGLQAKLDELAKSNKNVTALRSILRTRKKANKKVFDELLPEFYFLASAYYLAMAEMDINFVEGPFKAAMIAAAPKNPRDGYSRRTLRVLEKELDAYKNNKIEGVRQAYQLAGRIVSSQYNAAVAESTTFMDGSPDDIAARPSLSSQIESLQNLLKSDTGGMHG
ncbi:MAG: hypothetical protein HY438_00680 [DPANN group archaeon]|nr:hypothetical protein [DPANN group archaeon]